MPATKESPIFSVPLLSVAGTLVERELRHAQHQVAVHGDERFARTGGLDRRAEATDVSVEMVRRVPIYRSRKIGVALRR